MLKTLKPLLDNGRSRSYSSGSTILYQGEVPRAVFVLTKGVAKSFNISHQGEEQIVTFHLPGDVLSTSWAFGRTAGAIYFYEAIADCEVVMVPRSDFKAFVDDNPSVTAKFLDKYVSGYTAALLRVTALEQARAIDKLLFTFYYLARRFGRVNKNISNIDLKLTHQDIAGLVGLTRETVAVELNKLRSRKVISYANQQYSVDIDKLLEAMGEDSFKSVDLQR